MSGPTVIGKAQAILDQARATGKWEGELVRVRKDGSRFTARVTMTLRQDDASHREGDV